MHYKEIDSVGFPLFFKNNNNNNQGSNKTLKFPEKARDDLLYSLTRPSDKDKFGTRKSYSCKNMSTAHREVSAFFVFSFIQVGS